MTMIKLAVFLCLLSGTLTAPHNGYYQRSGYYEKSATTYSNNQLQNHEATSGSYNHHIPYGQWQSYDPRFNYHQQQISRHIPNSGSYHPGYIATQNMKPKTTEEENIQKNIEEIFGPEETERNNGFPTGQNVEDNIFSQKESKKEYATDLRANQKITSTAQYPKDVYDQEISRLLQEFQDRYYENAQRRANLLHRQTFSQQNSGNFFANNEHQTSPVTQQVQRLYFDTQPHKDYQQTDEASGKLELENIDDSDDMQQNQQSIFQQNQDGFFDNNGARRKPLPPQNQRLDFGIQSQKDYQQTDQSNGKLELENIDNSDDMQQNEQSVFQQNQDGFFNNGARSKPSPPQNQRLDFGIQSQNDYQQTDQSNGKLELENIDNSDDMQQNQQSIFQQNQDGFFGNTDEQKRPFPSQNQFKNFEIQPEKELTDQLSGKLELENIDDNDDAQQNQQNIFEQNQDIFFDNNDGLRRPLPQQNQRLDFNIEPQKDDQQTNQSNGKLELENVDNSDDLQQNQQSIFQQNQDVFFGNNDERQRQLSQNQRLNFEIQSQNDNQQNGQTNGKLELENIDDNDDVQQIQQNDFQQNQNNIFGKNEQPRKPFPSQNQVIDFEKQPQKDYQQIDQSIGKLELENVDDNDDIQQNQQNQDEMFGNNNELRRPLSQQNRRVDFEIQPQKDYQQTDQSIGKLELENVDDNDDVQQNQQSIFQQNQNEFFGNNDERRRPYTQQNQHINFEIQSPNDYQQTDQTSGKLELENVDDTDNDQQIQQNIFQQNQNGFFGKNEERRRPLPPQNQVIDFSIQPQKDYQQIDQTIGKLDLENIYDNDDLQQNQQSIFQQNQDELFGKNNDLRNPLSQQNQRLDFEIQPQRVYQQTDQSSGKLELENIDDNDDVQQNQQSIFQQNQNEFFGNNDERRRPFTQQNQHINFEIQSPNDYQQTDQTSGKLELENVDDTDNDQQIQQNIFQQNQDGFFGKNEERRTPLPPQNQVIDFSIQPQKDYQQIDQSIGKLELENVDDNDDIQQNQQRIFQQNDELFGKNNDLRKPLAQQNQHQDFEIQPQKDYQQIDQSIGKLELENVDDVYDDQQNQQSIFQQNQDDFFTNTNDELSLQQFNLKKHNEADSINYYRQYKPVNSYYGRSRVIVQTEDNSERPNINQFREQSNNLIPVNTNLDQNNEDIFNEQTLNLEPFNQNLNKNTNQENDDFNQQIQDSKQRTQFYQPKDALEASPNAAVRIENDDSTLLENIDINNETTTETTGFWKNVGSKLSETYTGAKDKVKTLAENTYSKAKDTAQSLADKIQSKLSG